MRKDIGRARACRPAAGWRRGSSSAQPGPGPAPTGSWPRSRSAARAAGTTCRWTPPRGACTSRTRRRWSSSTSTATRSSARSRRPRACTAIALAPELGRGFVSNGRDATVEHRGPEDARRSCRTVEDRREPGRDPLRAGAPRGLRVQRARQVGDRVRREDRRGPRHDPAARASPSSRCSTRRRAGSTTTSRTRAQLVAIDTAKRAVAATWPIAPGRGGLGPRARPRQPPAVRRLQQPADAGGGRHERQGPLVAADRAGRRRERLRPGHGPRLRLEQRRHADGGARRGRRASSRSSRRCDAAALADDDARPGDPPALRRGGRVRAGAAGARTAGRSGRRSSPGSFKVIVYGMAAPPGS